MKRRRRTGLRRELRRNDVAYTVRFGGSVAAAPGGGRAWSGGQLVKAVAFDTPIPGYKTDNCISLRLWNAEVAPAQFDLAAHNASDYATSVGPATTAFELCAVLYPGAGSARARRPSRPGPAPGSGFAALPGARVSVRAVQVGGLGGWG